MKNELLYIIIIFTLSFMMLFYGGLNYHKQIEYESSYFNNFKRVTLYKQKIIKYNIPSNYNSEDYIDLSKFEKISDSLIPNLHSIYFINIKPNKIFNIDKIFKENKDTYLMIIYNFNNSDSIELLINSENIPSESFQNFVPSEISSERSSGESQTDSQVGYFYKINKNITITNIYSIYASGEDANICIFFIIKPLWYI